MRPLFRWTLDGNKVISDPYGWEDMVITLERHAQYHSLIEEIDVPLEFGGNDGLTDGGYDYLKQAKANGIDTQVEILIEISIDHGQTYETLWNGLLDVTTFREIESRRKIQATLLRGGMWSKFINRKSIPVDVRSATTLDGAAALSTSFTTMTLPSQEIRKTYNAEQWPAADPNYFRIRYQTSGSDVYGTLDLPKVITDELVEKYELAIGVSSFPPSELFFLKEGGDYTFDIQIVMSSHDAATAGIVPTSDIFVYIQINNDSPIAFNQVNAGTSLVDERAIFTYQDTLSLNVYDRIRLWFQNDNATGDMSILQQDLFENSWIIIYGDTVRTDSEAPGFFIHDVGAAIARRLTGELTFYSEFFGGADTQQIEYEEDGCGVDYQLFGARNVRGETLDEKPFSMSFDDLWDGIDPIFNLGLGYEVLLVNLGGGGVTKEMIRVEPKAYFFDDSSTSVELHFVGDERNSIEIFYDTDFLLTSVENGYQKWESETISGNDDPQTRQTRASIFKTVGRKDTKDPKILSTLYAASIGIEQTRRLAFETLKEDWKLDEEIFIIETNSNNSVKLYSASNITGLLNAGTRYNVRLTPAANFQRWLDYLSIGFQDYIGAPFRFVKGEGNEAMVYSNPSPGACEPSGFTQENGDILVTEGLFLPIIYKFSHPLTWEDYRAIRDNRNLAIGVRYVDNTGTMARVTGFVKKLAYDISHAAAEFEVWIKTPPAEVEPEPPDSENTLFASLTSSGPVSYEVSFVTSEVSTYTLTGTSDSAESQSVLTSSVPCTVQRLTGVAVGDVTITYYKNSVFQAQDLVGSGNVVNESHTFTSVNPDDFLEVIIVEL